MWQLVTFNFLHGPLMHLVLNMLMIWMFGSELELHMGRRRFIILMAVSGMGAGLSQSLVMGSVEVPGLPVSAMPSIIGASGIVFGLLLVYGITWPNRMVLFMMLFPVKVKWMVVLMGVVEFLSFVGNAQPGVAHLAHLGGMLFAYVFVRYDQIHMRARKTYYDKKLQYYRREFNVHDGGKKDDDGPTYH
ncbi:MAG: rhomboid family intramembrane serine protease [Deltaproteobacteria bacterium]|nr:rhomboid family intramembrane serine protease [Deltaproteobacteria bacterium]